MKDGRIKIRLLCDNDEDYKTLENWYQKEEIYKHFEQRKLTYKEVKNKYLPRTKENAEIPVFMIEYENQPIGIIQYQLVNPENKRLYNITTNNCYEIDIFLGELKLHNKGIGRKSINLLSKYLFNEKQAKLLIMCPLKENIVGIKCYEHCGFKIERYFKTENTIGKMQEYTLMIKVR
ncbi:MAG: GNAT family N-acetyltransferase [Bacilli bacterium]|nr:GNAT family N-acetyltransferase [Bacilli bacterium]